MCSLSVHAALSNPHQFPKATFSLPTPRKTTAETADPTLDENGFKKDALPEGLSLGGSTITFYVRGDTLEKEFISENTGDVLVDALYTRDLNVEERLDVNLEYFANTSADFWGERNLFMDTVRAAVMQQTEAWISWRDCRS